MSEATQRRASRAAMALVAVGMAFVAVQPMAAAAEETTNRVVLRNVDTQPASDAAAKRLLRRIDTAAMEVCGASTFSFVEVQRAVRKSRCWHNARTRAVEQVGSPALAAVHKADRSL